jgi:hypothetical protein
MRTVLLACLGTLVSAIAFGQNENLPDVQRHNLTVGFGPGIPLGNANNYLNTAPLVKFGYGHRFNRFFQADVGFQAAFGAANTRQYAVQTDMGPVQGGDHEFMIPLGGRFIMPQPFKKVEVSAGGGAVYLHYSETAPSSSFYSPTCYTCTFDRASKRPASPAFPVCHFHQPACR